MQCGHADPQRGIVVGGPGARRERHRREVVIVERAALDTRRVAQARHGRPDGGSRSSRVRVCTIEEALPPFRRRDLAAIGLAEDAVPAPRDRAVDEVGERPRHEGGKPSERPPRATELAQGMKHGLRARKDAFGGRPPVGDDVDGVEIRRIEARASRACASPPGFAARQSGGAPAASRRAGTDSDDCRVRRRRHRRRRSWAPARSRRSHFGSYFQLRLLPSDSQPMAVAIRFCRVASVLASVTHSTYSRL